MILVCAAATRPAYLVAARPSEHSFGAAAGGLPADVLMAATTGTHPAWHHPAGRISRAICWPTSTGLRQMVQTLPRRALIVRLASASRSIMTAA